MFSEAFIKTWHNSNSNLVKTCNAAAMLVNEDGKVLRTDTGPCHGFLNRSVGYSPKAKKMYLISSLQNFHPDLDKAAIDPYMTWLVNDSPYADVFVVKDIEEIKKYNWVMRLNVPSNLLLGACIATRFLSEKYQSNHMPSRSKLWLRFIKAGLTPSQAFLAIFSFKETEEGVSAQIMADGHTPINANFGWTMVENFLNKRMHCPTENYDVTFCYDKVNNLWGGANCKDGFYKFCTDIRPITDSTTINLNIFFKEDKGSYLFSSKEDFNSLVQQLAEYFSHSEEAKKEAA